MLGVCDHEIKTVQQCCTDDNVLMYSPEVICNFLCCYLQNIVFKY